jgi:intracellular multiplication protein IcmE
LVAIGGFLTAGISAIAYLSLHNEFSPPVSQVTRMKNGNLLPGGMQGTPAQDALQKKDSQEKAKAAEADHKSYTPPIPSSTVFKGHMPGEVGLGDPPGFEQPSAKIDMPPPPSIVTPAPPAFTPPEVRAPDPQINGVRVQRVAAGDDEAEAEEKGARQRRERAIGDLVNGWNSKAPQTTVVIEPAVIKEDANASSALGKGFAATTAEKVLIPAGRGIYAHTILAVDSDTNGPIVLEADTGPIAGDRMIGTFSKSGPDRLIVKVETVEHRGKSLEANGIVIAPDTMEEAVATSVDQHYLERFVLPAAAAFVSGLGQAVALGNSTSSVSPFGGTTQTFGPLTMKQEALVAGGAAAQAVSGALTSSIPKGPTVHLAANVSVGVVFLSNVSIK